MAEMNELLSQAVEESDGLSAEVVRAHETVDRMLRLATSLGEGVEAGSVELQRRLEQLSVRLAEAEGELPQQSSAALLGLQGLEAASQELQGQVTDFLRGIRADLADLRKEKEQAVEEAERTGETTTRSILRYTEQVRELEVASETRLVAARERIADFREQVDGVRTAIGERREVLLESLRGLELSARGRLDTLTQGYDTVVAVVRDQLNDVQTGLKGLCNQVANSVTRKLGQEAVEVLAAAADPLKDAMADLEAFCKRSRGTCSENFADIVDKIGAVTGTLERLRQPLDMVKQYLR